MVPGDEEDKLQHPRPCAVTTAGDVVFIERLRDRVRVVDADGKVSLVAGGSRGYRDGPSAEFAFPSSGTLEGESLFIADRDNCRIRLIQKGQTSTFAELPKGVRPCAVVKCGAQVFATISDDKDGAHALLRLPDKKIVAGKHGVRGLDDGFGEEARFSVIYDMAVGKDVIYLADGNRIRSYDPRSSLVTTIAGSVAAGIRDGPVSEALFQTIRGLAVDHDDTIYVADFANNAIRLVKENSVRTLIHNDTAVLKTVAGDVRSAHLPCPCSLALDDDRGRLFVGTGDDFIVKIDIPSRLHRRRQTIIRFKLLFWLAHRGRAYLPDDSDDIFLKLLNWLIRTPASPDLLDTICDFAF